MNRIGKVLVLVLLLVPVAAHAQRPSNTVQTRSAELYLGQAERTQVPQDKQKFLKLAMDNALQGVQKNAGNSRTWFMLGQVYAATGDAVGADSAFDKAETMWPEYAKETDQLRFRAFVGAFNAGVTAIQQNNIDDAIAKLEAANAVYGKRPAASLNLGRLYVQKNQLDKAGEAYRHALEIMRGPEGKAVPAAEQAQWKQWEEAAAFNYAQILANAGKYDEAVKAYQDYLAGNPDNVQARSSLAEVYVRMGKQEEATKAFQDLLARDMSDEEFFLVGVGLFRGNQYEQAAEAFRKSITKNAALRDSYYNLAQAIYSQIQPLEESRSKATPADAKAVDAKLKPMYQELQTVAEKAQTFDPNNRTVLALLARAYRGMADVVDAKAATEWKNKTLGVMKTHQDLPFEVTDVALLIGEDSVAKLSGNVVNIKMTEGQPIKLTFSFLSKDGTVLGTQDVTVSAPKSEAQVEFSTTFKPEAPLGGWKYQVGT